MLQRGQKSNVTNLVSSDYSNVSKHLFDYQPSVSGLSR